jgi:hypothetical protein
MNTAQSNQEKRSIKVKDFLADFRGGNPDSEMLKKYHLTPVGLEKFYNMLLERGIVTKAELQEHYRLESLREREFSTETSSFICPCCLASHEEMFDICPSCGVSFQELISRETLTGTSTSTTTPPSASDSPSVSLPPAIIEPEEPIEPLKAENEDNYFMSADNISQDSAGFEDSVDEIGHALESMNQDEMDDRDEILCDSCDSPMHTGLRDIYDQTRTKHALIVAAASFVLGLFGILALGFFEGFSFLRLVAVYATAMSFVVGTVFLGIGAFMFMAREKVFFCPSCTRVFPRG